MKKRFFALLSALVLVFALCAAPAWAEEGSFVYGFEDDGHYWVEENDMLAQEIFDDYGIAVCYAHEETLGGMTVQELARSVYDAHAPSSDGFLLLDCDEADEYCIYCSGAADGIFTDDDITAMCNAYAAGGSTYDDSIRAYLLNARDILARVMRSDKQSGIVGTPNGAQIPAERQLARVVDNAGVLDAETLAELNDKADAVSEQYQCDIAVVFTDGTGGKSIQAYADDFFDYNGYGYGDNDDGILLAVDVTGREFALSTHAYGAYAFTDAGQSYMDEEYVPYLADSDWAGAADAFITVCEELLISARAGQPYDVDNIPSDPPGVVSLLIAAAVGLLLAFIPVGIMKGKLKSVGAKRSAESYVRPGSFELTRNEDHFIRRYVSKTRIPKSESSGGGGGGSSFHTSSSGRSHGGHSGSF